MFLTSSAELASFCHTLSGPFVALDTEFVREKTYWPQMCLVQIASPTQAAVIDLLAPQMDDLTPLAALLERLDIVKVLHSCRQDLEGLHHLLGVVPRPLFDTQIAALFLGYVHPPGYDILVQDLLGQTIDKSLQYRDWAARPLPDEALAYALGDVIHLAALYPLLRDRLETMPLPHDGCRSRGAWMQEEMELWQDPALYTPNPAKAWKKVKGWGSMLKTMTRRDFALLHHLAAFRETEAIAQNLPRSRILHDALILKIVGGHTAPPPDLEAAVAALSEADLPTLPHPQALTEAQTQVCQSTTAAVRQRAEDLGLSPAFLATRDDIESLIRHNPRCRLQRGWRAEALAIPPQ